MDRKEKFEKIIAFLETIYESQFNYQVYVTAFDECTDCGTVCCVGGWFPKIFPEDFEWVLSLAKNRLYVEMIGQPFSDSTSDSIQEFLEISQFIYEALFCGIIPRQISLGLPKTSLESASLPEVIHLFKEYKKLYIDETN